jgi:hypothetical protein
LCEKLAVVHGMLPVAAISRIREVGSASRDVAHTGPPGITGLFVGLLVNPEWIIRIVEPAYVIGCGLGSRVRAHAELGQLRGNLAPAPVVLTTDRRIVCDSFLGIGRSNEAEDETQAEPIRG